MVDRPIEDFEDDPGPAPGWDGAEQATAARAVPRVKSAADLQNRRFAPIRFVVPDYVTEGATILAGAPKLGKSWLVLDMALAVATGGTCLGSVRIASPHDVLYLALEDNERRMKSRIDRLMPIGAPWPVRFGYQTEWPRAHDGGIDGIRAWAKGCTSPRLVIIDVLQAFRQPVGPKEQAYVADYTAIKSLTELAAELQIAIVIVHHTRKSRDQVDPFDRVSGTLGISGAADSTLILDRAGEGVTLYGRGRDMAEVETAVTFSKDACRWRVTGPAAEARVTAERQAVTDALRTSPVPLTPVEISDVTGRTRVSIRRLLAKMLGDRQVERVDGKYAIANPSSGVAI